MGSTDDFMRESHSFDPNGDLSSCEAGVTLYHEKGRNVCGRDSMPMLMQAAQMEKEKGCSKFG